LVGALHWELGNGKRGRQFEKSHVKKRGGTKVKE
jgi:hypothetical protein